MLPTRVEAALRDHLARVRSLYEADRQDGLNGVWLPEALAVKEEIQEDNFGARLSRRISAGVHGERPVPCGTAHGP